MIISWEILINMVNRKIKRGDIYIADLDPVLGAETGKERRVLIVSNDIGNELGPTVIAVPITTQVTERRLKMPMFVKIEPTASNGQTKLGLIDCNSMRSLSKAERLQEYKGFVDRGTMIKVDKALEVCLSLKRCYNCDHVLMPNKVFCNNCKSIQVEICGVCMNAIDARHNYCGHCGTKRGGNHE